MNIYEVKNFSDVVKGNSYPGRGIVAGMSENALSAVIAYFIMGRSENSRNRIFVKNTACASESRGAGDSESAAAGTSEAAYSGVFTEPFDPAKVKDPSLIIYRAVGVYGNHLVVTNGDQTDTIIDALAAGSDFYSALSTRCFEPDAPNLTPRISAEVVFNTVADKATSYGDSPVSGKAQVSADPGFTYKISILKSEDADGSACSRYGYSYTPLPGIGHFIHTYEHDGNPLPSFQGEPRRVSIPSDIDDFTSEIWNSLDKDNKISLYVRYTDLGSGDIEERILNKNEFI